MTSLFTQFNQILISYIIIAFIFLLLNFKTNNNLFIVDVSIFNVKSVLFLMISYIFLFFKYNFMMRNHFSLFSHIRIKQTRLTLLKYLFFIMIHE